MTVASAAVRSTPALLHTARPAAIALTGIVAGAVLGTWLSEASFGPTGLWIAYHQAITPAYTRALPSIGGLALIAALATLAASWGQPRDRRLTLAAVACLVIGLLVTVVVHFPINAQIATWQPAAPPADWQQLRGRWLAAHAVRTVFAVAGFALLVAAGSRGGRTEGSGTTPA